MASKPSSPGPSALAPPAAKQARSRKAATQKQDPESIAGRAGSAGGTMLDKAKETKAKTTPTSATAVTKSTPADTTTDSPNKTRRKPRKLNKDPTPAPAPAPAPPAADSTANEVAAAAELEALKSRVRGLEAKVEELYKTGSAERSNRSPRRRGKGRKGSSAQQVPTLSSLKTSTKAAEADSSAAAEDAEEEEEEEEGDEEVTRLESELSLARQDLARYRPRTRRTRSSQTTQYLDDDDDVEEISRGSVPGVENTPSPPAAGGSNAARQVTLSGSYRIPLPASVNTTDLKTIQDGVSAAHNVARSFLEQRRARQHTAQSTNTHGNASATPSAAAKKPAARPKPAKALSSSMQVVSADDAVEKQTWGEWIGGYSMAISRAVKNIEHEAAVESRAANMPASQQQQQQQQQQRKIGAGAGKKSASGAGGGAGKRPPARAKMSSEQVHGLMS